MENGKIRIIVADPGKPAEVREIDYGMLAMKDVMGGEFSVAVLTRGCAVFQPKRARERKLPFNRVINLQTRTHGRVLIARLSEKRAADIDTLSEAEIADWMTVL